MEGDEVRRMKDEGGSGERLPLKLGNFPEVCGRCSFGSGGLFGRLFLQHFAQRGGPLGELGVVGVLAGEVEDVGGGAVGLTGGGTVAGSVAVPGAAYHPI